MKILVLGAGGIGGFFGSHLHEVKEDVTFLVREKKKLVVEKKGIHIKSAIGNISIQPNLITKNQLIFISILFFFILKTHVIADINPKSKNNKDKWIAIDKVQHFGYSLFVSLGSQYILVNKL